MRGKACQTIVALLSTGCCCYGELDLGKFHPLNEIYRHIEDLRGCPRKKKYISIFFACTHVQYVFPAKDRHSKFLSIQVLGKTYEQREIRYRATFYCMFGTESREQAFSSRALVFCFGSGSGECSKKPSILIDGGIHAREWAAVSTAVFIMGALSEEQERQTPNHFSQKNS